MRNLWITSEHAFATWTADLEACRGRPEQLVELVAAIVEAGERHRVFLPVELPAIGFSRARDGALAPRLVALWREHQVVDAFAFTDAAMAPGAPGSSTVEAELAWFDRDDRVVHGTTADPAEVGFNQDGSLLVVTEKAGNRIDTYAVDELVFQRPKYLMFESVGRPSPVAAWAGALVRTLAAAARQAITAANLRIVPPQRHRPIAGPMMGASLSATLMWPVSLGWPSVSS